MNENFLVYPENLPEGFIQYSLYDGHFLREWHLNWLS